MRTHINSLTRLNCSVNGNPRFVLHTVDGDFITSSDSMASYEAENAVGKDVMILRTRSGRVTNIGIERFKQEDLEVCTVCAHLIANGEYNDGTDAAEVCALRTIERHPEGYRHMIVNAESEGYFSTSKCDACGDTLHGDRHGVTRLTPQ